MSVVASVPTSFEGPFGKILYKIRAFIDTPRFSKDYKTQKPFYLLNVLNLNELPDIEVRPGYVGEKKKIHNIHIILYAIILYYTCSPIPNVCPSFPSNPAVLWQQKSLATSW